MKRVLALFVFIGALVFVAAPSAMAAPAPYPAPPVTSSCLPGLRAATAAFADAAPTTCPSTTSTTPTDPVNKAASQDGPLAFTGAGFNVALVVGSAILVVLVGLVLMVVGARMSRRGAYRV